MIVGAFRLAGSLAHRQQRRNLTKAALIPLIKRIHPDLFHIYGEEVSSTNKRCVQNLYELAEFLRLIEEDGKNRQGLSPLRPEYCLDFYMESEDGLRETNVEVVPNKLLCELSVLRSKRLDNAVNNLKMQVGQMYLEAGLLDPLKRDWSQNQKEGEQVRGGIRRRGGASGNREKGAGGLDVSEIDRIIYERSLAKKHDSILTHSSPARTRKNATTRMELEADAFIRSGSVLLQNMSQNDEVIALERLRTFLVNYGTVLNLSSGSKWQSLYMVIKDSEDGKVKKGGEDSYKVATSAEKKRVVVEIPKDFHVDKLLKSLASVAKG
jgi:hypothetical protein